MAQEKEEAAVPGNVAPDDTQPSRDSSIPEDGAPLLNDLDPDVPAQIDGVEQAERESDELENVPPAEELLVPADPLPVEDIDTLPDPSAGAEPSPDLDATESPEPDNLEPIGVVVMTADTEIAEPDSDIAQAPNAKVRRILPARPSSPAALTTATFATKTPWTPLRKLAVCVIVAWVLILVALLSDELFGFRSVFYDGLYAVAAVIAGIVPGHRDRAQATSVRGADRAAADGGRHLRRHHREAGAMPPFCSPAMPPCWPSTT